jgi:Flp pilus assembly protein TadD
MRTRAIIASLTAALALTLTGCSSSDSSGQADTQSSTASTSATNASANASPAKAHHYASAQGIANALKAAGLTVSKPQKETEETYISKVGGTAYNFTVTDKAGKAAPGTAGINMFPNAEALAAWVPLSKSLGGVAVTGDTWAVSLPTEATGARADSKRLAPKVAAALNGTVQE